MQKQSRAEQPEEQSDEIFSVYRPLPIDADVRWFSCLEDDVDYWAEVVDKTVEELFAMTVTAIRTHHGAAQVYRRLCPEGICSKLPGRRSAPGRVGFRLRGFWRLLPVAWPADRRRPK